MKTVGLVTEYNPFHNGHKYHIEEAKRITGADYAVAVMSGDFVQRGMPAVIDKYSRAEMALQNGVDLVLELPVCYATGSAEFFAHGAVSLLDKLGIVDTICFGSECGDIRLLDEAARFLSAAPAAFDEYLQAFLKDGLSFPTARLKALQQTMEKDNFENSRSLSKAFTEPNNILGIEYMKAIHRLASSLEPVTMPRKSSHYHDSRLAPANPDECEAEQKLSSAEKQNSPAISSTISCVISSATAIRKAIRNETGNSDVDFEGIRSSIPDNVYPILSDSFGKTFPIIIEDFAQIIRYKLLSEDSKTLSDYMDLSGDLAERIKNLSEEYCSVEELIRKIKTRNMTLTRINRALVHILLNIRTTSVEEYIQNGYTPYARVLGIKKESSLLLRKIEKTGRIPIITKVSKAAERLDHLGMQMLSGDIFAAHLYNQAVYEKFGTRIPNEYRHGICIIEGGLKP